MGTGYLLFHCNFFLNSEHQVRYIDESDVTLVAIKTFLFAGSFCRASVESLYSIYIYLISL